MHVSDSDGGKEVQGNSHAGRDVISNFKEAHSISLPGRYHGCMSGIQMQVKRCRATHNLEGMSSAIQTEARRRTATHILEGMSWLHVSDSNGDQDAHGNSQAGRDVMDEVKGVKGDQEGHHRREEYEKELKPGEGRKVK